MSRVVTWLSILLQRLWTAVALVLVLGAVLMSLVRLALPLTPQYKSQITQYIEAQYGIAVSAGRIDAVWQTYGPKLIFTELDFTSESELPTGIKVQAFEAQLNFWRSLLQWQPIIGNVTLSGLTVNYQHSEGASTPNTDLDLAYRQIRRLFLEQLNQITIRESQLTVNYSGTQWRIAIPDMEWGNWEQGHRGVGRLQLEGLSQNTVDFILEIGDSTDELTGTFYVNAKALDLSEVATEVLPTIDYEYETQLNLEVWADFGGSQISSVQMRLNESYARWFKPEQTELELTEGELRADYHKDGWKYQLNNLTFALNDNVSQKTSLNGQWMSSGGQQMYVSQLDIEPLIQVASELTENSLLTVVSGRKPTGLINDLHIYLDNERTGIAMEVANLSLSAHDLQPGIPALNGALNYWDNQTHIQLAASDDVIDVGNLLPSPIPFNQLSVDVYLEHHKSLNVFVPSLVLDSDDIQLDLQAKYLGDSQYLSLKSQFGEMTLATVKRLFPRRYMPENTKTYLNRSLRVGKVEGAHIIWNGRLNDFPFTEQQGIFQAGVDLALDDFAFNPDWPSLRDMKLHLLFENNDLFFTAPTARMDSVLLTELNASMPTLSKVKNLYIDANSKATGVELGKLMRNSPLKSNVGEALNHIVIDQPLDLSLNLVIPLKPGQKVIAKGDVGLSDVDILFPDIKLPLNQVNGDIVFNNELIDATNLTAKLFNYPIQLNAKAAPNEQGVYATQAQFSGDWPLGSLFEHHNIPLQTHIKGDLDWKGDLALRFPKDGFNYDLQVSSNLGSVESTLPYPLNKSEDEQSLLFIDVEGDLASSSFRAIANQQFKFNGLLPHDTGQFSRAHLTIGETELLGLGTGFSISLGLPSIDLVHWTEDLTNILRGNGNSGTGSLFSVLGEPKNIFINTDELVVANYGLSDVEVKIRPVKTYWASEINAKEFRGRVNFSRNWLEEGVVANIDYLNLKSRVIATKNSGENQSKDFTAMPPVQLQCSDCRVDGVDLGQVNLRSRREGNTMFIDELKSEHRYLTAELTGQWSLDPLNPLTSVNGRLTSSDVGIWLNQFDIETGLRDAGGNMNFDLAWEAPLVMFNTDSLTGSFGFDLDDGYLKEFNDEGSQVSRVLGLLSLKSLIRKLRFDFRDVFNQGFFFEDLAGNFVLTNGVAATQDFFIDGPGLDFSMNGSLDLNNEAIDFNVGVIPNLTSSIPVLLWMVNPGVGLASLALDEAIKSAKVVSNIQYEISGTLGEPTIKEISRDTQDMEIRRQTTPEAPKIKAE